MKEIIAGIYLNLRNVFFVYARHATIHKMSIGIQRTISNKFVL